MVGLIGDGFGGAAVAAIMSVVSLPFSSARLSYD